MDDSSSSTTDTAAIPNPFDVHAEWALSDFYAKYIASTALIYDLPKFLNHNLLQREAAGGWNFSLRWTARSGNPVNIVTGQDNALSGTPKQRPNLVGSPNLPSDRSTAQKVAEWFNTSLFTIPAAGTYGDAGRNVIIGPGLNSTNVALMKNFTFTHREPMYLQFRAEAFSVFNTPIFSNPGATLGSSLGKITSTTGGDRHFQFALKLVW